MRKAQPGKVIVVAALILSIGGHWAVLQGIAWSTMLVRFASQMPLVQAIQYTFDGEHPCALCKSIQKGSAEEKNQERPRANADPKIELLGLVWQESVNEFCTSHEPIPAPDTFASVRAEEPPSPVPRGTLLIQGLRV